MTDDTLHTAHVAPIDTGIPGLEAFRITGALTGEDVSALSQHVTGIFQRAEKVDLLISFRRPNAHRIPAYNVDTAKVDVMALKNLRNLAVANAPEYFHDVLDAVDKLVPVAIRCFASEDEALAWLRATHQVETALSDARQQA